MGATRTGEAGASGTGPVQWGFRRRTVPHQASCQRSLLVRHVVTMVTRMVADMQAGHLRRVARVAGLKWHTGACGCAHVLSPHVDMCGRVCMRLACCQCWADCVCTVCAQVIHSCMARPQPFCCLMLQLKFAEPLSAIDAPFSTWRPLC